MTSSGPQNAGLSVGGAGPAVAELRELVELHAGERLALLGASTCLVLRGRASVWRLGPASSPDWYPERELLRRLGLPLPLGAAIALTNELRLSPWEALEPIRPSTWQDVGEALRAFHAASSGVELTRLPRMRALDPEGVSAAALAHMDELGLTRRVGAVRARLKKLPAEPVYADLAPTALHLDAKPANVIVTAAGARLVDLDALRQGPWGWDLIRELSSGGRKRSHGAEHESFERGYGASIDAHPDTPLALALSRWRYAHWVAERLTTPLAGVGHARLLSTLVAELEADVSELSPRGG